MFRLLFSLFFSFFNDPPTTAIYTLSLHDALPISSISRSPPSSVSSTTWGRPASMRPMRAASAPAGSARQAVSAASASSGRSEEHTSELQSRPHLVCRLLLEKKKKKNDCSSYCYQS